MSEIKTKPTNQNPLEYIKSIMPLKRVEEGVKLLDIFSEVTGEKPVMWGSSIVGFGKYHYVYKSGQEGDWPLVGFSPRKEKLSLYIMMGNKDSKLLKEVGKHKSSVGCLYINKLEDIDLEILKKLIKNCFDYTKELFKEK